MLLDTFDRFNRRLAESSSLRRFVEQERETALRIMTGSDGPVQPRIVAAIEELIQNEARDGHYEPPVEPSTLAYAIVRLAEAFLFNDVAAGHPRRRRPPARRRGRAARRQSFRAMNSVLPGGFGSSSKPSAS